MDWTCARIRWKRVAPSWSLEDYDIPGAEGLKLHHFYRAMAWLGEELEEKPGGALAPRSSRT